MGSSILRGISMALLVTVLTLLAGTALSVMDLGSQSIIGLLDFGLLVSCLIGGYRTAKESGKWWLGGIAGSGYVSVGTLLLALFLPIREWGFIQVLAEGTIIGLVAGAVAAGGNKGTLRSGKSARFTPSYAGYETNGSSRFTWDEDEESKEKEYQEWDFKNDESKTWELNEWEETAITTKSESGEKSSEVEWPWDKEKKTTIPTIAADAGDSKSLVIGEPEFVRTHFWERNRSSLPVKKAITGSKPWWEE